MKVAHFGIFVPNGSGQFETVRDLIKAERSLGIEAGFIDYGYSLPQERPELRSEGLKAMPVEWAKDADIIVRHSGVPSEIQNMGIPVVLALHGRPENSFSMDYYDKEPGLLKEIVQVKNLPNHAGYFTFWDEFRFIWEHILDESVTYIPALVDLDKYKQNGERYDFNGLGGSPNIVIADMWREDTTPFNVLWAAAYYREHFNPEAKIHVYGATNHGAMKFLHGLQKEGVIGELYGQIHAIDRAYRGADMIVTPHVIATRVIREAMSYGIPIVAGGGCQYTEHTADPRNIEDFANAIRGCWQEIQEGARWTIPAYIRNQARGLFDPRITAKEIKEYFESILQDWKGKKMEATQGKRIELTVSELNMVGKRYCERTNKIESEQLRTRRRNERPIETAFVFKHLTKVYPSTVLDVGCGMSSLPHLMGLSGFEVTAIDKPDFWASEVFNRHFQVIEDDITDTKLTQHFDFITCVSTLEHIPDHNKAVANMVKLLNPGGRLLITVPYNEYRYSSDVYQEEDSFRYGDNAPYVCQVFSKEELLGWIKDNDCKFIEQEYWKVFKGDMWTFGRQCYPPVQTTEEGLHQLSCIALEKSFNEQDIKKECSCRAVDGTCLLPGSPQYDFLCDSHCGCQGLVGS